MRNVMRKLDYCRASIAVIVMALSSVAGAQIAYEETTSIAGFRHSGETYGASWGDFNGDGYPDLFVGNHREWASLYRNNGDGTFVDVILTADGSGVWKIKPKQDSHGAGFADYDGDGDKDIYVTTGGADPGLLLVNDNNILYDMAADYGVAQDVEGRLPVWFDYQNDGLLDLAMMVRTTSRLYRQNSPVDFNQVTGAAGFECDAMDYGQLTDLDGDGTAEFICGNGTFPRKVYDVTTYPFTDITANVESIPRGTDTAIADFDGDLDPDIFVIAGKKIPSEVQLTSATSLEAAVGVAPGLAKGFSFDTLGMVSFDVYVKRQLDDPNNVFIGASGWHPADMSFTLDPADPNVQGKYPLNPLIDAGVFISYDPNTSSWEVLTSGLEDHAAGSYYAVSSTMIISNPVAINLENGDFPEPPYYLDNINGILTEDGAARGLTEDVSCVSVAGGDMDNDMDVDVYVVCRGGVQNLPNRIYENDGAGNFSLVQNPHGAEGVVGFHLADEAGLGDSVVMADYDADGCLDVFLTNGLPLQPGRHDSGPDQLFRNQCNNGNHWIQFDLVGGVGGSNPDGIGAKVFVTAGGVTQVREQNGGYHRWSQNDQRLHFGLGANTVIDQLVVEWPSGTVDVYPNVDVPTVLADQMLVLHESQTSSLTPVVFGGGDFPAPQLGNECGEPEFNAGIHEAIFLWKDCTTGVWSMTATAGWGPNATYDGSVVSDQAFVNITLESIEGADIVDTSVAGQILYSLFMSSGGRDGLFFELAPGASGCFFVDQPNDAQLLLGAGSVPAQWPLDLNTLGSCASLPEVTIDDVVVAEGAGVATFTVSLSASSADQIEIDYATVDGSAMEPGDYGAVNDTLILVPGEMSGTIDVTIVDDADSEGTESFVLTLSNALNALVVDADATATINDNEVFECGEPDVDRTVESGVFLWRDCPSNTWRARFAAGGGPTITFDGIVSSDQSFASTPVPFNIEGNDLFDTSDPQIIIYGLKVTGAAQDGFDLETAVGAQTCFELNAPGGEQIYLGVGKDPVGTSISLETLGSCNAPPEMTVADITVNEGDGTATFTVSLSASSADQIEVQYATSDGTAGAPDDYTATADTLIIAPGATSGEIDVPIIDDPEIELPEDFTLALSNPVNAVLTVSSATATIDDNEVSACGEPEIDRGSETGLFLWRDCFSNNWHMRVTAGGGPKLTYDGQVGSSEVFPSPPVPFSVEGADSVDDTDPQAVLYSLNVANSGWDGFGFEKPATGQTCFELSSPGGVQIFLGEDKTAAGTSVDLDTLAACTP